MRRLWLLIILVPGLALLFFQPIWVTSWQTEPLLALHWGKDGPTLHVGLDGRPYGPTDFFSADRTLYVVDPFGKSIWAADLQPRGRLVRVLTVPEGVAAAARLQGGIAWADDRTGAVGIDRRVVGHIAIPPMGILSVLDFQGAGPVGYLLVRLSDLYGIKETLYLVDGNGLRRLGSGIEGIAVPPGSEAFYFVQRGALYAPDGRPVLEHVPGVLVGVDRRGVAAFLQRGRRQAARVLLVRRQLQSSLRLPGGEVVLGTRARYGWDGALVWARADATGLFFYRTVRVGHWALRRRF